MLPAGANTHMTFTEKVSEVKGVLPRIAVASPLQNFTLHSAALAGIRMEFIGNKMEATDVPVANVNRSN